MKGQQTYSDFPCEAAGVFACNRVPAAPFTPVLRFVVASDVHFLTDNDGSTTTTIMPTQAHDLKRCAKRVAALFTRPYEYAAGQDYNTVDAYLIGGDSTDDGSVKQIHDFFAIVKEHLDCAQTRLMIVNGNHEVYDTGESHSGANEHKIADARLVDGLAASGITNYNVLKFHTTLKGYHFIGYSPTDKGARTFGDEVAAWLDGEITAAVEDNVRAGHPDNPVFVFQHLQMHSTVFGSPSPGGVYSQTSVREVLDKHPQAVDFGGHTHAYIDHPRSVWQDTFTAVSTGTLAYSDGPTNTRGGSHVYGHSDPYNEHNEKDTAVYTVVELDADNRMRLRYFYIDKKDDSTALPIGERIINVGDPAKFNWTAEKLASLGEPCFPAGAALTRAEPETPTALQVAIPQAQGEAGVITYRCEIYLDGVLQKTVTRLSGQFSHPFDACVVPFTGLAPATTYTVRVCPVDCLGRVGEPLEAAFTTAPQESVFTPDIFSAQFNADGSVVNGVNGDVLVKNGAATVTAGKATFTGAGDFQWRGIEPYYELMQTTLTFEVLAKLQKDARGKFIVGNFEYHVPPTDATRRQVHGGFGFYAEADGRLSFYLLTSNTAVGWHNLPPEVLAQHAVTTKEDCCNGLPVHLVGTYDGENIKFYVNGALVGTLLRAGVMDYPLKTTTQYLSLGGDSGIDYVSRDFTVGELEKVNLYATAMTEEQVAVLYRMG